MRILTYLLFTLFSLLGFVFLELNKNTVLGWMLWLLVCGVCIYFHKAYFSLPWLRKIFCWIVLPVCFGIIVMLSWPPVRNVKAVNDKNPQYTDIITISQGQLQGVFNKDHTVEVYAGIPYAKPPVGDLRWKEPQDPDNWQGVLQADAFAPMSMQPVNIPIYNSLAQIIGYHDYQISLDDNYRAPVSEDSLYLNIWKPSTKDVNLPVLVYIHGGSLQTGQPWYADYSGEGLAKEGVIVVNMGYRLGVFGFLGEEELQEESIHHTTGNYGLLDQIKALEWVQENIASFGGDPDNVTLAGESAGAACVSALCTSPLAKGLFQRAIGESSSVASVQPPHSFRLLEDALSSGKELPGKYNCSSVDDLRRIDAKDLVDEAYTQHHITIDGYVLEELPYESYVKGNCNEKQLLHGYNLKESGPFLLFEKTTLQNYETKIERYFGEYKDEVINLYPAQTDEEAASYWADIYSVVYFHYSHYCWNRMANLNDIPVYEYLFAKDNGRLGCWHSGEEVYCYGNIPDDSRLYDDADRKLSSIMTKYWANFCKYGNPNGIDLPEWKANDDNVQLMEFNAEAGMSEEKYIRLYEILDRIQGWNIRQ